MTTPEWTQAAPVTDIATRLHALALRIARIRLAHQAQRNAAVLQALRMGDE